MRLITAHKILIASAVVFFVFFGLFELDTYRTTGGAETLVSGIVGLLIAVGFALYLRTLKTTVKTKDEGLKMKD